MHSTLKLSILLISMLSLVSSASAHSSAQPSPCTPLGFANTVVLVPASLATTTFRVKTSFTDAHLVIGIPNLPSSFSQAAIATFCLEQCVAFSPSPNSTIQSPTGNVISTADRGPCRSFNISLGRYYPPTGDTTAYWFCLGFDEFLDQEGGDLEMIDAPGSFTKNVDVDRVYGGGFRAY